MELLLEKRKVEPLSVEEIPELETIGELDRIFTHMNAMLACCKLLRNEVMNFGILLHTMNTFSLGYPHQEFHLLKRCGKMQSQFFKKLFLS